eukprot:gene26478-34669_t
MKQLENDDFYNNDFCRFDLVLPTTTYLHLESSIEIRDNNKMSEASPTPLSVKDRIALLKSTPSPPSVSTSSNTATSRPKSTNNIAEKLAALKAASDKSSPSLVSSSLASASVSSSSSSTLTGSESATKTPSKDRSKSLLSDRSATSIIGENVNNTPSSTDVKTVGSSSSIEERIAALKTSSPAATVAATFTSPSTEATKNAGNSTSADISDSSQSTPAVKSVRKGSIADRIAALKNEPGGDLFSPSAESFSSASSDSVANKNSVSVSFSGVQATEEQDSNAKSTAKSNETKRISARLNNVGFNPFGPRPTPTSSTASAADAVTATESEVKKSEHSDTPKEIVHLSMSRPTIAAGRRKGKNLPSVAVFSADTESLSSASPVKSTEGAAI